jgi:hypothetical protein
MGGPPRVSRRSLGGSRILGMRSAGVTLKNGCLSMVRSFTGGTGALVGAVGAASPVLADVIAEEVFGRPSSTNAVGLVFAFVLGVVGAGLGGLLGSLTHSRVRRSRWAGPVSQRVVAAILMALVVFPAVFAIKRVRNSEAFNRPRVVQSTGAIARARWTDEGEPRAAAKLVWYPRLPEEANHEEELHWNGAVVRADVSGGKLRLKAGEAVLKGLDLNGFDYVREVYGATARLQEDTREWLVLLARLRATGRRELVLVLDPEGKLAYEELLERARPMRDGPAMWRVGGEGGRHGVLVLIDQGSPIYYTVSR